MERILIKLAKPGANVRICGFVYNIRRTKKRDFLILQDHTGKIQVLIEHDEKPNITKVVEALTIGSTIQVLGMVMENSNVKMGGVEIIPTQIKVETIAKPIPINSESSQEVLMDYRWINLRDPKVSLIFKAQTILEAAMREFWLNNGFLEMHSPKLMGTASESGSELFSLQYFKEKTAYLAQSPQLYKQMAMAAGYPGVFEIGPVFRANPSFTSRHDTEFTSVDTEIAWIDSHEDVMKFEELWIRHMFERLEEQLGGEIEELYGIELEKVKVPFPRITFERAKSIAKSHNYFSMKENDFEPDEEKLLGNIIKQETGSDFVFVTEFPISARPFYHMRFEERPYLTKSYDLFYKGIEITTGAQREHHPEILCKQILEKQVSENDAKLMESLQNYLQFFDYGMPPHGGFGFGLTRVLMKIFNLQNVRQATYLYRGPKRLTP